MVKNPLHKNFGTLTLNEKWDHHERSYVIGAGELQVSLFVTDIQTYPALVFGGSKGLGRSYVNGFWSSDDLTSLIRFFIRTTSKTRSALDAVGRKLKFVDGITKHRKPTKSKDRENIHAHYDLSNEFFKLMLDETMAYSCAIFPNEYSSLKEGQVEKFDRICRKLKLTPGEHILEIGSGWGGFAIHAASNYGVRVTTTTISENQRVEAIARAEQAGVSHLVTVLGDHYGDLEGRFDALVSIEMIEAVNWRQYGDFFSTCNRLLRTGGRMALQAITIADESFERAKYQEDFIRDLIFPGGGLPSVAVIIETTSTKTSLKLTELEDIGLDYVRTLQKWQEAVHTHREEVKALDFDDRFFRLWDLYLEYCAGAFLERHISDVQMFFVKSGS
jgi:cyclopropane-fatty-acyl-phospholipid synthase